MLEVATFCVLDFLWPDSMLGISHSQEPGWTEVVAAANTVLGHQEKLSATGAQ